MIKCIDSRFISIWKVELRDLEFELDYVIVLGFGWQRAVYWPHAVCLVAVVALAEKCVIS